MDRSLLCGEAAVFSTEVEVHQEKAAWGLGRVWPTRDSLSVLTMGLEKKNYCLLLS